MATSKQTPRGTPAAVTFNELSDKILFEIMIAKISEETAEAQVVDMIERFGRVQGEHSQAIAKIGRDALANARKFKGNETVMFRSEMKKLGVWLGAIQLGWL